MKTKSSRLVIRGGYFYKIKLKITLDFYSTIWS